MNKAQKFNTASGFFFFFGFIVSKLQYLPFSPVSALLPFISLALYLGGYTAWFSANLLESGSKKFSPKEWQYFIQTKIHFMIASLIGIIATGLSLAAVFVPVIFPPAAWIFFLGNLFWIAGEYYKLKNPHQEKNFCLKQQEAKFNYAITTATMALITALAATLIFLFPPLIVPITVFSVLLSIGLGILAFEFFLKASFPPNKSEETPKSSRKIERPLEIELTPQNRLNLEPLHSPPLFSQQTKKRDSETNPILSTQVIEPTFQ